MKKVLVTMLAVAMTVSMVPAVAFADTTDNAEDTTIIEVAGEKAENPAKLGSSGSEVPVSGKCGKSIKYSIDVSSGVLELSGSGAMYNYSYASGKQAPWYGLKNKITSVKIGSGITSIGNYAFYNLTSVSGEVYIPNSVKTIGSGAFSYSAFTKIFGGRNVTTIGARAFKKTTKLSSFSIISKKLSKIGAYAFQGSAVTGISIASTTKLSKKGVKTSLKGSSVKKVNVKNSKKIVYKYYFSKSNAGKSVKVY